MLYSPKTNYTIMAEFKFKAVYLVPELPIPKLKDVIKHKLILEKRERLVFEVAPKKYIFIYSFGAVVFYDVDENIENETIKTIKDLKIGLVKDKISDEYLVIEHIKTSVEFNQIKLKTIDFEKLRIISLVLAQSVALENYEIQVEKIIDQFSALNKQLKDKGKLTVTDKELMKIIGTNSSIIEVIVSKLALLEKPASAWESEETELLFNRLHYMFEIEERFKHIQYKLNFIQNNSELMLDMISTRRGAMLELIIIILIVVEIAIWFYELFFLKV